MGVCSDCDTDAGKIISGVWWDAAPSSCIFCQVAGRRRLRLVWVQAQCSHLISSHLNSPRLDSTHPARVAAARLTHSSLSLFLSSFQRFFLRYQKKKKVNEDFAVGFVPLKFLSRPHVCCCLVLCLGPGRGLTVAGSLWCIVPGIWSCLPADSQRHWCKHCMLFYLFSLKLEISLCICFILFFMLSQKPYNQVPEKAFNYFILFKC